jgi:hypothetical protein
MAFMARVADALLLPALLLQDKLYVFVPAVFITPVLVLPLALLFPLQLPLAVHDVGLLVALQLIVELLPVPIVVGLTPIVTTGLLVVVPDVTDKLAEALPEPPPFWQVRV